MIYNIPAGIPFAAALAQGLLEQVKTDDHPLTQYRILLPTRRACRNLRESFLQLSGGKPLLLPQLQPLGDVEEDELVLELAGKENAAQILSLPPAMSPLRRHILLARAIMKLPQYTRGPDQDFALAGSLGHLMDQIYTEGLDLKRLPELVEDEKLAQHWQITVKFLEILSERWPEILAEQGVIDAADRRNRLMEALTAHWKEHPPQTPIIAAGSTGSIPATAKLLQVITGLPKGFVILPGLDAKMDEQSWETLNDTHPQATLKQLLEHINIKRTDVQNWEHTPPESKQSDEPPALSAKKQESRNWLAGEMMRPAATADHWQNLSLNADQKNTLEQSLQQVMRFECDTAQEEAKLIALLMRDTLETPGRTAALVTPDRILARRVAMICQRWNIEIDDSGGQILNETVLGSFLRLAAQTALTDLRPSMLAALLKHKHCYLGQPTGALTGLIARLEINVLRGQAPGKGFQGLYGRAEEKQAETAIIGILEEHLAPFMALCKGKAQNFTTFLDAHIKLVEDLATTPNQSGEATLWQGEDGVAAALFLADLRDQGGTLPNVTGEDYLAILEQLMRTISVRPSYGTHPRLFILGQLEARQIQADLIILSGLNEGTWPPDPGNDPWMSRPMRQDFNLPSPERSIGLAAHDFVQGFCNPHIVLTHARRVQGTPAVPARWLQRLNTVLQALNISDDAFKNGEYLRMARALDMPQGETQPATRPAPCPPVSKRPDELYVTAIEKWMRDPYSVYARYILKLKKLPDIEKNTDNAQRGTMMHDVLDHFIRDYPDSLPPDAHERLITLGQGMLAKELEEPRLWGFWWPRFERLSSWFVSHERQWRQIASPKETEISGAAILDINGKNFTLRAKADRIDEREDGFAVIDYKTGGTATVTDINNGYAPQLPLEAVILLADGFAGLSSDNVSYMGFWKMTGGTTPGEEKQIKTDPEQARLGLIKLVRSFRDETTPYYSLPRPDKAPPADWQDYAHLARVQEWAALDDSEETA